MVRSASFALAAAIALASTAHAQDAAKPAVDPDKIICKRHLVTGSLADSTRECHTRAEWTKIADQNRDEARRVQQSVAAQGGTGH
jgi:hypothetical protein